MNKILTTLGLAFKAGFIIAGEEGVLTALQKQKAKMVFVAKDASESTIDKFKRKCYFYKVPCSFAFTTDELSSAIGKMRKIIAVTDPGMVQILIKVQEVNL